MGRRQTRPRGGSWSGAIALSLAAVALVGACGAPSDEPAALSGPGCAPGEILVGAACAPPGVDFCAEGFEPDGRDGCRVVGPEEPCAPGTMALPGELVCRPVSSCEPFTPTEATLVHVDGAANAANPDGSAERPWPRIQDGIDHAPAGATVIIAAGTYTEDVVLAGKPLELLGACPELVAIVGSSPTTVQILAGAAGSTLRKLAITGSGMGLRVDGAAGVAIEEVWLHHTGGAGLLVGNSADTGVTLRQSLIEETSGVGAVVGGVALGIEGSVIRAVSAATGPGIGVYALRSAESGAPATLTVRGSIIEGAAHAGAMIACSEGLFEGSLVRDSRAEGPLLGGGIIASSCLDRVPTSLRVVASVIEHNVELGLASLGADTIIEATTVREVLSKDGQGPGVLLLPDFYENTVRTMVIARSLVEGAVTAGIAIHGGALAAERLVVRDTRPGALGVGDGLIVRHGAEAGALGDSPFNSPFKSHATVRGARFEGHSSVGVLALGADLSLDRVHVDASGGGGWGVAAYYLPSHLLASQLHLSASSVEGAEGFGVLVVSSFASIEKTRVADTRPSPDGRFGDGVAVVAGLEVPEAPRARLELAEVRIEGNARAGLANFGADAGLRDVVFSCNALSINGESEIEGEHHSFAFEDRGGNRCGCGNTEAACEPVSSQLKWPDSASERPLVTP